MKERTGVVCQVGIDVVNVKPVMAWRFSVNALSKAILALNNRADLHLNPALMSVVSIRSDYY